jgi:hypothetical protein
MGIFISFDLYEVFLRSMSFWVDYTIPYVCKRRRIGGKVEMSGMRVIIDMTD